MASGSKISNDLILWNLIETHLDEAEFLFERWDRALTHPGFSLGDLARLFESRLFAHIDALVIGGVAVAEQFLLPELQAAKDLDRATAIGLALLSDPAGAWIGQVLQAALRAEEAVRAGLIRALILTESPLLDAYLEKAFQHAPRDPAVLDLFTGRGINPPFSLRDCLESSDARLAQAAQKAVKRLGRRELYHAAGIRHPADPGQCNSWKTRLQAPETVESALWHLGFCGTAEAGDLCAAYLNSGNQRLVKLAADSLAWIGGLKLNDAKFHLSRKEAAKHCATSAEAAELDAETIVELDGVDLIPVPNAASLQHWWTRERVHLGAQRFVCGKPFSTEAVHHALMTGPLWRRHHLALELSAESDGKWHISTGAFSARQIRQLKAMVA